AALQRLGEPMGEVLLDVQLHGRRRAAQDRDQLGQQVGPDGVDRAEAKRPGERIAAGGRDLLDARRFLEHALRLLYDFLPGTPDRDFRGAALEQRHAELFLELL